MEKGQLSSHGWGMELWSRDGKMVTLGVRLNEHKKQKTCLMLHSRQQRTQTFSQPAMDKKYNETPLNFPGNYT